MHDTRTADWDEAAEAALTHDARVWDKVDDANARDINARIERQRTAATRERADRFQDSLDRLRYGSTITVVGDVGRLLPLR